MRVENKICSICDNENWFNLDYLRDKGYWFDRDWIYDNEEVTFKICMNCGYVTYDYKDENWLNEHYDQERRIVKDGNIITCNRKNLYHKEFIEYAIADNKIKKFENPRKFLDIGMAQGYFLNFLYEKYGISKENLYGTEYSKAFRDFAKYEYGLENVSAEIDESIKYDFISCYHVFEHIQYPDKALKKFRDILTDDGLLYISIPHWFDTLEEASGTITNDFENLYHLNHVNVFSIQSFQNILKKIGFEIIKENRFLYGYTVLCKKCNPNNNIIAENWEGIKSILEKQKSAIELLNKQQPESALELYPKFPDAYIFHALNKDNSRELIKQKEILEKGLNNCPDSLRILEQLAKVYFQWDENNPQKIGYYSNNIKKSEELFLQIDKLKPGENIWYFLSMIEAKYKNNLDKAVEYMRKRIDVNPLLFQESMNFIAQFWKAKGEMITES